ncbi:MAG: hypothetical protein N2482_02140 [Patescibacteria group bacterium]|nr:hypothetical protein [Patescibacteria group bacterium]
MGLIEETVKKIQETNDIFIKGRLIKKLIKEEGLKVKELTKKLGLTSAYICHLQRMVDLPELIIDGFYSKQITLTHLFIISRLKDKKKLIEVYEKILTDNLNTAQTEELVREALYQIKGGGKKISLEEKQSYWKKIQEKEKELNVKIIQTRIKGKIVLEIRGNPVRTTPVLKRILKKLSDEER